MGMFTNYQAELLKHYQPNNLVNSFPTPVSDSKLVSVPTNKPCEEYDLSGKHTGYSWRQGETVNLDFSIEGEIFVEPDAKVSFESGATPLGTTTSIAGKKYYNLADLRSWCSYISDGKTIWVEDSEFTYPESGIDLRPMYMSAESYLKDKNVVVTLYNFRMEPIHTWNPEVNGSKIVCCIDRPLSEKLVKGIYYCNVVVENQLVRFTVFDSSDCFFVVK